MTVTPDRTAPPTSAAGGYRGYSTQAIADMIALGCTESVVRSVIDLRIAARAEQAARAQGRAGIGASDQPARPGMDAATGDLIFRAGPSPTLRCSQMWPSTAPSPTTSG